MADWGCPTGSPGPLDDSSINLGHSGHVRTRLTPLARPLEIVGASRLASRRRGAKLSELSGYQTRDRHFKSFIKIIDSQSALFGMEIGLDELSMSTSHGMYNHYAPIANDAGR